MPKFKKGDPKPANSGAVKGQKYAPTIRKNEIRAKFQAMEDKIFDHEIGRASCRERV